MLLAGDTVLSDMKFFDLKILGLRRDWALCRLRNDKYTKYFLRKYFVNRASSQS
jgi:hypothetical protein